MEGRICELPPSKRFKLLQRQEEEVVQPSDPSIPNCLPVKKLIDSHLPTTNSYCLPAKKRVWAPHHLSPIKSQAHSKSTILYPQLQTLTHSKNEEQEVGGGEEEEEDDGIVCAVCRSTDGDPLNPIVLCDGCDLMVHALCYGNPLSKSIPEGDWFCLSCESKLKEKQSIACCLCPVAGGAVKPTTDGRWAHISCALLVPEAFFKDPNGRGGIDCSRVPIRRWKEACYLCGTTRAVRSSARSPSVSWASTFHVDWKTVSALSSRKGGREGWLLASVKTTQRSGRSNN